MSNLNDKLMARMRANLPDDLPLELPPKVFVDMGAEFTDYTPGKSLTVRLPVKERYQNPMKTMQGGVIAAAIDNTLGPLSFLEGPPNVTTQLNISYIRPVTPDMSHIFVRGWVVEQTRSHLFMSAYVLSPKDKVLAIAHATCMIR